MYLITLLIFALLNVNLVEPGDILETKDAATEANDRFKGMLISEDDEMAFDAAEGALTKLEAESKSKEKEDAKIILQGYLNLQNVYESLKNETVNCNNTNAVDEFYKLHQLMSEHNSHVKPSKKLRKSFPLTSNLLDMRKGFLNHCGLVLSKKLGDLTRSDKIINGVQLSDAFQVMEIFRWLWFRRDPIGFTYIDNVISGSYKNRLQTAPFWSLLYDKLTSFEKSLDNEKAERMNLKNMYTDEKVVTPRLFESTCGVVEQDESFVKLYETLFKMMKMTKSSYKYFYNEEKAIIDYVVCQEARTIYLDDKHKMPKNKVLAKAAGNQE